MACHNMLTPRCIGALTMDTFTWDDAMVSIDGIVQPDDEVEGICETCDGMSTFMPDANDEDNRLICVWCGTLAQYSADYS